MGLKDYWSSTTGGSFISASAGAAQTFTPSSSYSLDYVELYLNNGFSVPDSGDVVVEIKLHATSGGQPAAEIASLGTVTYDALEAAWGWTTFTPASSIPLTSGTTYALVMSAVSQSGTRYITWYNKAGYTGGVGYIWYGSWSSFDDWSFKVYGTDAGLSKPTTPTPADSLTPGVDFSTFTFSWVNGGGATAYDVYIGDSALTLNRYVEDTASTSYTPAVASVARSFIIAVQDVIYWRVDAKDGGDTATGDVWKFDPRPAAPTLVTPADSATDQTLHVAADWNAAAQATTYELLIVEQGGLVPSSATGLTATDIANLSTYLSLRHSKTYDWQVNARNQFGLTDGPTYSFSTMGFTRVTASYELLPGKTLGPTTGGTVGVDFRWTGGNNMVTVRGLVVAANNRIWYEEVF